MWKNSPAPPHQNREPHNNLYEFMLDVITIKKLTVIDPIHCL